MTLFIASLAIALGISGLCSLLEAALLSYSPSQVATLAMKHPRLGQVWKRFKENIERPISVILVLNTAAHTIGATLAGAQFKVIFGEEWLIVFSLIFTYVMLQFTEILPKTLGVRYNAALAPVIAPPLEFLVRILGPFLTLIHFVNRPFERRRKGEDKTLEEIGALAANARLSRLIDPQQARMIQAASDFEDIRVRQVMTPRADVSFLRVDTPVAEVLGTVQRSPYTRLPLCEEDIDHIIGMVHVKDILKYLHLIPDDANQQAVAPAAPGEEIPVFASAGIDLRAIRRDVVYLPEHLSILDALQRFQAQRLHLGVVVDEYGATEGIITLEDVLEEMVGDIVDEFDPTEPRLFRKEGETYRVGARLPLHHLANHIHDVGIDIDDADVDTVGGFVSKRLGRMPTSGDSFDAGPYTWTVTSADERRVKEVRIKPRQPESAQE